MGVDTLPVLMVSNQLLWGVGWLRDINDFDEVGMLQMLLQRMAEEVQGVQGGVGEREKKDPPWCLVLLTPFVPPVNHPFFLVSKYIWSIFFATSHDLGKGILSYFREI